MTVCGAVGICSRRVDTCGVFRACGRCRLVPTHFADLSARRSRRHSRAAQTKSGTAAAVRYTRSAVCQPPGTYNAAASTGCIVRSCTAVSTGVCSCTAARPQIRCAASRYRYRGCGIYRYAGITSFSSYISGETAFCRKHFPQQRSRRSKRRRQECARPERRSLRACSVPRSRSSRGVCPSASFPWRTARTDSAFHSFCIRSRRSRHRLLHI